MASSPVKPQVAGAHDQPSVTANHDTEPDSEKQDQRSLSLAPTVHAGEESEPQIELDGRAPYQEIGSATSLEGAREEKLEEANVPEPPPEDPEPPYSIYPHRVKVAIMLTASFMALVSPLSSAVYYPAIPDIARDLHVTPSLINLSITTYMIFQAIAPSFVASISDVYGRRPAYVYCFIVYLGACIGLAVQDSYAALMVLRCLQSTGSSGTIALASAVVADLSTRAERGTYIGYATMAATLGPSLGPLFGGLLNEYKGWRYIFWFLSGLAGGLLLVMLLIMPETCRAVVGNGSIPPPRWNRSLLDVYLQHRNKRKGVEPPPMAVPDTPRRKRPNPLKSVTIVRERSAAILLIYTGLTNAGYFLVLSTLTTELSTNYGLNSVQVGLAYLPIGLGSLTSRWTAGYMLDWNFRRLAKRHGLVINTQKQQDISTFPIEKARMEIQIPAAYMAAVGLLTYGWVLWYHTNLAGPLIMSFFLGHGGSACNNCLNTLLVDTHRESPATAAAASNLVRCLFSAAATAFALPLINAIGIGWTGTMISLIWVACSPLLWILYFKGLEWRIKDTAKAEAKRSAKRAKKAAKAQAAVEATAVSDEKGLK